MPCTQIVGTPLRYDDDDDDNTQKKSVQRSLEAWPYRRECRGHNTAKKNLLELVRLALLATLLK